MFYNIYIPTYIFIYMYIYVRDSGGSERPPRGGG